MRIKNEKINDRIEACLIYIDELDDNLKELIKSSFLEVVLGKKVVEQSSEDDIGEKMEMLKDATKYIYSKTLKNHRVGILGELLFHVFMRDKSLSERFLSTYPTIAHADTYKGFYKGFDGIYYCDGMAWVAEVKSKVEIIDLNKDNEKKIRLASKQLEKEMNDKEINRWQKAKLLIPNQLGDNPTDKNIRKIFQKNQKQNYNQIIGTLLIYDRDEFDIEKIKEYAETLYHMQVKNQNILLMCIRSYDYNEIIKYIKEEMCDEYEF